MNAVIVWFSTLSFIILISVGLKVDRYWSAPTDHTQQVETPEQMNQEIEPLLNLITGSGFITRQIRHFPKREAQSDEDAIRHFPIMRFSHPACFAQLYVMVLKDGAEAALIKVHSPNTADAPRYVYANSTYQAYPTLAYFIDQNWQGLKGKLGLQTRVHDFRFILATLQVGTDCDLRAKIPWQKLWSYSRISG